MASEKHWWGNPLVGTGGVVGSERVSSLRFGKGSVRLVARLLDLMRWNLAPNHIPCEGDIQTRYGFLFIPKRIGNQVRWLEYARWTERCEIWCDVTTGFSGVDWNPVEWLT